MAQGRHLRSQRQRGARTRRGSEQRASDTPGAGDEARGAHYAEGVRPNGLRPLPPLIVELRCPCRCRGQCRMCLAQMSLKRPRYPALESTHCLAGLLALSAGLRE